MPVTLAPAATLDEDELAELFTAVYAGYWHPIEIDAAALRRMVASYDLDLEASTVALDGAYAGRPRDARDPRRREPGSAGWASCPTDGERASGELLTRHLVATARDRGVHRVRLEVLEQNAAAQALYRRLGFELLRDVAVWQLDSPPAARAAPEADLDEALDVLADAEASAPWQRSPATVDPHARARQPSAGGRCGRRDGRCSRSPASERRSCCSTPPIPPRRRR